MLMYMHAVMSFLFFVALLSPAEKGLTSRLSCVLCFVTSSLQCYNVLSDILVKNESCIPLER